MMGFRLGIDLGFARNRYQEPEVWPKIVKEEFGLSYVSLIGDIMNPDWPSGYLEKLLERTKKNTDKYGVKVEACFTSSLTRFPHMMHYDAEMRRYYLEWFKKFFRMAASLGCRYGGSHFGVMSFTDYNNEDKRNYIIGEAVKGWQELSFYAKEIGFDCLMFEPMSVPREMGNTVDDCIKLMEMVNENAGVPMKICLDIGHAPHPDERDPYRWIERLGNVSPMIHLQQTVLNKSNHAPFTEEFNKNGIIDGEKVMAALKKAGAADALMVLEISHREHYDSDFRILEDLRQSVDYWRKWIKE
jgi:D-erythrulose 1-phosphate 3-epimerase